MSSYFHRIAQLARERTPFVLATVTHAGGSTPGRVGTQMAVFREGFIGTIGGGAFEKRIIEESRTLLEQPTTRTARFDIDLLRDLGMACGGQMSVFLNKHDPAPRVVIFGAGHVGTALATIAQHASFDIAVVDSRAEWADPARFDDAVEVICADPVAHIRAGHLRPTDYIAILTYGHTVDQGIMAELIERRWAYLGLIGSRAKWARFRQTLLDHGHDTDAVDQVRCPVGIDIGASTPEEIAISIVAQMIQVRSACRARPAP